MNGAKKKPEIIVFAAPNGSGKSTITGQLRPQSMPYVNADEIQKALCCTNLETDQKAEELRVAFGGT